MNAMLEVVEQVSILALLFFVLRGRPRMNVVHSLDSRLQHFFHTTETRLRGRVDRPAFKFDAETRGCEECVLLGVNANADVVRRT